MQKINERFVSITYGFLGLIFFVSLPFHMTFDILVTPLPMIMAVLLVAISINGRGAVELIVASVGIELGIINDVYF